MHPILDEHFELPIRLGRLCRDSHSLDHHVLDAKIDALPFQDNLRKTKKDSCAGRASKEASSAEVWYLGNLGTNNMANVGYHHMSRDVSSTRYRCAEMSQLHMLT